jgi:hypothetical protein
MEKKPFVSWSLSGTTISVIDDGGEQEMAISKMMPNSLLIEVSTAPDNYMVLTRVTN